MFVAELSGAVGLK